MKREWYIYCSLFALHPFPPTPGKLKFDRKNTDIKFNQQNLSIYLCK